MEQLIYASLSHPHCWYKVGMLKVPVVYTTTTSRPTSYSAATNVKYSDLVAVNEAHLLEKRQRV